VKLSQLHADVNSAGRFLRYHAAVETAIEATNLTFTFLRPNLYIQGLLNFAQSIKEKSAFFAAAGEARISAVDVRDLADVAVAALTDSQHKNKSYSLTGPEALTFGKIADELSAALGRTISFVDVPPEVMRGALEGAWFSRLASRWFARRVRNVSSWRGARDRVGSDRCLGSKSTAIRTVCARLCAAFRLTKLCSEPSTLFKLIRQCRAPL
jgi:uncharacterized protein YbjT (DUF2867 family)